MLQLGLIELAWRNGANRVVSKVKALPNWNSRQTKADAKSILRS